MVLNFWSVILIASASQCLFLIALLAARKTTNVNAKTLLISLLVVMLATNVHNLWYAGRIYYSYPRVAGFGRGLTLLTGPLFYLYSCAIVDPGFKLKWKSLLHALPYFLGLSLVFFQPGPSNMDQGIQLIDSFMTSGLTATPLSVSRFVLYIVHLLIYIVLARRKVNLAASNSDRLMIPIEWRVKWVRQINVIFLAIAALMVFNLINMTITGRYSFYISFLLTLEFSAFIYLIAYQAMANAGNLIPDFHKKYETINIKASQKAELLPRLIALFERDKMHFDPKLKQADIARALDISPHVLTGLLNNEMGKSFFELLNEYRIKAFIEMASNPDFGHLSIQGIAEEVGYRSKSSFNTAFKKQTGQTPSEYLKTR